jgi:hypothetical protein
LTGKRLQIQTISSMKTFDEARLLQGPAVTVYVPPTPPRRPEDMQQDVPPGDPPEVHYLGVSANYWRVLEEGKMPFFHGAKVFSDEQMNWLRGIQVDVVQLLLSR